jgi:hypothetical protein
MSNTTQRTLLGIQETADRWSLSPFSIRRLISSGELKSINVGARILVPISEIERAEQHGVGKSRKDRRA